MAEAGLNSERPVHGFGRGVFRWCVTLLLLGIVLVFVDIDKPLELDKIAKAAGKTP